jgi:hypothetical protein
MPAASYYPIVAAYMVPPMIAFAVCRLLWFLTYRIGKSSNLKFFLIALGISAVVAFGLAFLTGASWPSVPGWLRVIGGLGVYLATIAAAAALAFTMSLREALIQLSGSRPSTWLTGISVGILGCVTIAASQVDIWDLDAAALVTTSVDTLLLRRFDLMHVATLAIVCICFADGSRYEVTPAHEQVSEFWRFGIAGAATTIFFKVVDQDLPSRDDIIWFAGERADLSDIPHYRTGDFQEIVRAFWQADAIAILSLLMVAALLLLPLLLSFRSTRAWRRFSAVLTAILWFAASAFFASNYPQSEFAMAKLGPHSAFLLSGLTAGALLGTCMPALLNRLAKWRSLPNAHSLLKLISPPWIFLSALTIALCIAFLSLPAQAESGTNFLIAMSIRFGIVALAAIWSIRHCARIYSIDAIQQLIDETERDELKICKP